MEIPDTTLYPISFVREWVQREHGVGKDCWYYHVGKAPAPDVELSGYQWYSVGRFAEVRTYFAANLIKKRKAKSQTPGRDPGHDEAPPRWWCP